MENKKLTMVNPMFTLIQLSYAMEALEPVISAETISFHHGKHLQAYVDNLNKLLPGSGFEGLSLMDIVRQALAGAIFNNAGQILNHEMYFTQFKPAENVTLGTGPLVRFYEGLDSDGPTHDGEVALDESNFRETARFRVCPREGQYGIQVSLGAWHSVVVHEPSTILESKDGAYGKKRIVRALAVRFFRLR